MFLSPILDTRPGVLVRTLDSHAIKNRSSYDEQLGQTRHFGPCWLIKSKPFHTAFPLDNGDSAGPLRTGEEERERLSERVKRKGRHFCSKPFSGSFSFSRSFVSP